MDVLEAICSRRSIKKFKDDRIGADVLSSLLEAARVAPSGGNKQPREYVVVTERDSLEQLAACHPFSRWLSGASAGLVLLGDPAVGAYWLEDACVAGQNIWLACTGMGLGVAWSAIFQQEPVESARREGYVRGILGIPDRFRVVAILGIGFPDEVPVPKERRALSEVTHWEKFGLKQAGV